MSFGVKLGKAIVGALPKGKPWATYEEEEYYLRAPRKGEHIEDINDLVAVRVVTRQLEPARVYYGTWDAIKYLGQEVVDTAKWYASPHKWFR